MELPKHVKNLYRHWPLHVAEASKPIQNVPPRVREFIQERIRIWEQKTSGKEPPYTTDPVFAKYRFCNVYRELDRQTMEFHIMLGPLRNDFPLWLLNMFYARMVARPETLRAVGLLSFDTKHNKKLYEKLMNLPRPRYGTPYVFPISVIQHSSTPTRELFITSYVPSVMQKVAREIEQWDKEGVSNGVGKVLPLFGFPFKFLWTEVLIDVAYQYPERLDLFRRFPVGPGAKPTFEAIAPGRDPSKVVEELARTGATSGISYEGLPLRLSAENWEGIGCEYRKYTNLSLGKGRRRVYNKMVK